MKHKVTEKMKFITMFAASLLFGAVANANTVVLDFEAFPAGTIVDTEYAALGVSISAINFGVGPDHAVVFDSNNPTGGDSDLAAPFHNPDLGASMPGNLLILQENHDCDAFTCTTPDDEAGRPAGQFLITFADGVLLRSIDFFDVEGIEASPQYAIELYDGENNRIPTTFYVPDTGGDNMWAQVLFDVEGVHSMVINMGGSGAIDNLTFETRVVPVPAALPLFLSALASFGFARRRG